MNKDSQRPNANSAQNGKPDEQEPKENSSKTGDISNEWKTVGKRGRGELDLSKSENNSPTKPLKKNHL